MRSLFSGIKKVLSVPVSLIKILFKTLAIIALGLMLILPGLIFTSLVAAGALAAYFTWGLIPSNIVGGAFVTMAIFFFSMYDIIPTTDLALDNIPKISESIGYDMDDLKDSFMDLGDIISDLAYDIKEAISKKNEKSGKKEKKELKKQEKVLKKQEKALKKEQVVNNKTFLKEIKGTTNEEKI